MKPSGTVTFLFTDIEGSTKLAQEYPDTLPAALEKHHSILRNAIEFNNGFVFKIVGDAFCCSFEIAGDAVNAAVEIQSELMYEKWEDAKIIVRIGIHTGSAEWDGSKYSGYITLAKTARIMSAAHGGQILVSEDAYELCLTKEGFGNENGSKSKTLISNENEKNTLSLRDFEAKEISFRDLGERKLKDVIHPIRLYQILYPGLREDFPPIKTLDARPNNLPVPLNSFIGREGSIKFVKNLLRQTRLLTIIGAGGSGKSRLALRIATEMIDEFANGVFISELAPVSEPTFVVQTIMTSVGLKEDPDRSPVESLIHFLNDKELLIVLDNCEHLIEESAKVAEILLSKSKRLKIITTSREALNCLGEQTFLVPQLTIPGKSEKLLPENLVKFESINLFTERALSVNPKFHLDNNNSKAVADICRRLDGIPLALELAAAGTKYLSVENISARLDDRFNLLKEGKRTALPRHQTLKSMIDWSYELLSEKERLLWNRLSVFKGGWNLESAEEICSDEKITRQEIFDLHRNLTEKSIIIFNENKDRYSILETIKEYGEEKLKEDNGYESLFNKHLNYYIKYSENAEQNLRGSEISVWLEKLDEDHLNFQSAVEWSLLNSEREKGARLAVSLYRFWDIRGHHSTGIKLLLNILESDGSISKPVLGKVYLRSGQFARFKGEYEIAKTFYEESLTISRELGDKLSIASSLTGLGNIEFDLYNFDTAKEYYEKSLTLRREAGDKNSIAKSLNNLGNLSFRRKDFEQGKKYYEEFHELTLETGDKRGIANSLHNLGSLAFDRGDFETGNKYYEESLALKKEMGDKAGIAEILNNLGKVFSIQNNYDRSRQFYEESLALYRELGVPDDIAKSLFNLGDLESSIGNYEKAISLFKESITTSNQIGSKKNLFDTFYELGFIYLLKKNFEECRKCIKECMNLYLVSDDKLKIAKVLILFTGSTEYKSDPSILVKLLGAAEAVILCTEKKIEGDEEKLHEKVKNELQNVLSEEKYREYFEEGKMMTPEEAVQLAVNS